MRRTAYIFMTAGAALLLFGMGSLGLMVYELGSPDVLGLAISGGTTAFIGIIFLFAGRYIRRVTLLSSSGGQIAATTEPPGFEDGVPATAQVIWTRDTGTIINNTVRVVDIGLLVDVADGEPYEAVARHGLDGARAWQPLPEGARVAVLVDPDDPARVTIAELR